MNIAQSTRPFTRPVEADGARALQRFLEYSVDLPSRNAELPTDLCGTMCIGSEAADTIAVDPQFATGAAPRENNEAILAQA